VTFERIGKLIGQSYSADVAKAFAAFAPGKAELDLLGQTGFEVLKNFPYTPGACAMMSAMYTARMEQYTKAPVYMVAGNLFIHGTRVFGYDGDFSKAFESSNRDWDGHCWLVFGRYIADVSLFRTAYSKGCKPYLAQYVAQTFGKGRGLMMLDMTDPNGPPGLRYDPQHVLSYGQVSALVGGCQELFANVVPSG
jgi:hypothetical protein